MFVADVGGWIDVAASGTDTTMLPDVTAVELGADVITLPVIGLTTTDSDIVEEGIGLLVSTFSFFVSPSKAWLSVTPDDVIVMLPVATGMLPLTVAGNPTVLLMTDTGT